MQRCSGRSFGAMCIATLMYGVSATGLSAQPGVRTIGTAELMPVALPPLIGTPAMLVGQGDRLILVDYSDMSVHWADADGRWLGRLAKVGGGPGEIREVAGVQFSPEGQVWISDGPNSRVSVRNRRDLSLIDEFRVEHPVRGLVPSRGGASMLAVPSGVQHMLVVVSRDGTQRRAIAFPARVEAINPIARERQIVRVSDSLSVVQFRWLDVRIGLEPTGARRYTVGGDTRPPEIVTMKLDQRGSVGYRIGSAQKEFAVAVAARGDTLLAVRGSPDERDHKRIIARYEAHNGRLIDHVRLPRAAELIAATDAGVFMISETDDGFAMYRVVFPR